MLSTRLTTILLAIAGSVLIAGTTVLADDVAEIRFGVGPIPARRSLDAEVITRLWMVSEKDGQRSQQPVYSLGLRDRRRDERTALEPLTFRVFYDLQRRKEDRGTQDNKEESEPVEGRSYLLAYDQGRTLPTMRKFAPPGERRLLRTDYARYKLTRDAALLVRGTTARPGERSKAVEEVVSAFFTGNPTSTRTVVLENVEARLQSIVIEDGQRCARFGFSLKATMSINPKMQLIHQTSGTISLRMVDALPVHMVVHQRISSPVQNVKGENRSIVGASEARAWFRYGNAVPALPAD